MTHTIRYDPDLPISAWRDEISATIRDHQVVVVAGETGSGKTTQLPKICLELGRRSIGHTQPRRIAARTVAERVASELGTELGHLVGYQVRFTRKASRQTRLKIMTDGVLLAEVHHDRDLRRYDTIIIDEAHERSLNIDFLLGYLRQLVERRSDLKIILTSATIDTDRFAAHFGAGGRSAPIIEVSGRTYPVEIRYRPLLADGVVDQVSGIVDAVTELSALGGGDILVFCSGEREIRDAAEGIASAGLRNTSVLPLYARLSAAEQHRVFAPHSGRRVVVATNVAETSLTVPGIRYVVDSGTARMSRYSARTKVQRLPIEPISKASADQRAGRCGRVAPGVCVRLYSEEDFESRPDFTEPEILRTNLASVILQMAAADLGPITDFPFVEAPDRTQVTDGLRLLDELGALSGKGDRARPRLTGVGRRLAQVPTDPRLARMLLAGERQGCLRELLVIVSGLSIVDPRERPAEHREQADALHRRFWAPVPGAADRAGEGDFVALLRLWDYIRDAQRRLSGNGFRRLCREEFLHFLRIREWQDLHAQLRDISRDLGLNRNQQAADLDRVHAAVLTGLLSHVGLADLREEDRRGSSRPGRRAVREYLGARGTRFAINPGSSAARASPPLVMAAEIVETTRLWARTVAGVSAAQIEEVGGHLLRRAYSEPHWSARSGSVMAYETVTLYGVPIISRRRVGYQKVNPVEAREIFLRSALVEGQWRTRHSFFADNAAVREEAERLEERTRRRDLVVDDQAIFDFYDARVPAEVTSATHFDSWWKRARQESPDLLSLRLDDLVVGDTRTAPDESFPESWAAGAQVLDVSYRFEPGHPEDGVGVDVPVSVLNQVDPAPFSWQVPGLRTELATELIRSLPKALRRQFVPAPEFAGRALDWLHGRADLEAESLEAALGRALHALTGEQVPVSAWDPAAVPPHLRVTFHISDGEEVLASGKDLAELKRSLAAELSTSLNQAAGRYTRTGLRSWDVGTIPELVEVRAGGRPVVGYPALTDEHTSAGLALFDTPQRQRREHEAGLRRLVTLNTPDPTKWVISHLGNAVKLALGTSPYPSVAALLADARLASVGELMRRAGGETTRDEASYRALCDAVRAGNADLMRAVVALSAQVLTARQAVLNLIPRAQAVSEAAAADVAEQVGNLVFAGFLVASDHSRLTQLPRYLAAAERRLQTLLVSPRRDDAPYEVVARCEDAYAALCEEAPPGALPDFVDAIGWQLEELRVSLFAQELRTSVPVSEKRVMAAIGEAHRRLQR